MLSLSSLFPAFIFPSSVSQPAELEHSASAPNHADDALNPASEDESTVISVDLPLALANLSTTEVSFMTRLNMHDLRQLSQVNRAYHARFGEYVPRIERKRETWLEKLFWMLPPDWRAQFSEAFKRALRADQLDIARGDAALMQAWGLRLIRQLWMAKPSEKEREFVQCLFLNTLLQLPHYRIALQGHAPRRTAKLPAGLRAAYASDERAVRDLACIMERVIRDMRTPRIKRSEWIAILRDNGIHWRAAFPLEATDNGLRLKIDACCAQWLSHPDRRERLQNVMTLTELIRKSPDQEVSAVSFAEFLMRHPMRAQTEAFVEILALVIATLAKYCMHFNVCSHAQWPPFRRTLLNPLSDGTPAFESRLWQEALCLSHQIIYDQSSGVRALNPELCADAPLYGAMPLFHTLA
ncbi:exported hypothetical protein [Candidatus Glomeribacter gigasporarum BEG34]|uniref:Uncharacterized protein n=1 Tax=Candidatus Glomeribacter gigasporarum BEG34 TaxID=1070319 RepID=G2J8M8_9BURK|nr:hypothetical protein [Candidatus Glomeribacter gigasporarum]CCD29125.1 exported hypothetical protein [Candidatus Glomeribacter gigasporarum BEG34]